MFPPLCRGSAHCLSAAGSRGWFTTDDAASGHTLPAESMADRVHESHGCLSGTTAPARPQGIFGRRSYVLCLEELTWHQNISVVATARRMGVTRQQNRSMYSVELRRAWSPAEVPRGVPLMLE